MDKFNLFLNYLTRGEWNKPLEEEICSCFFREYKLRAIRMPDYQCEDIYNGFYVPFVVEEGRNMKGVKHFFNDLESYFVIKHVIRRVEYLRKNKLIIKEKGNVTSYFLKTEDNSIKLLYKVLKVNDKLSVPIV